MSRNPEKWEELLSEPAAIGKNMSTKQVGSYARQDVTNQYKYPEGVLKFYCREFFRSLMIYEDFKEYQ